MFVLVYIRMKTTIFGYNYTYIILVYFMYTLEISFLKILSTFVVLNLQYVTDFNETNYGFLYTCNDNVTIAFYSM